jgi:zinc transport system substrate-binding protein
MRLSFLFSKIAMVALITTVMSSTKVRASEIVATIKPLHSLLTAVVGNTAKPYLLVSGNSSPHGFEFKPSQVRALSRAKIVFFIDEGFETFMEKGFRAIPSSVAKVAIAESARVKFLSLRKGGTWEKDKGHDHGHAHGDRAKDLHVWLDPNNAIKMVKAIVRELTKIYPENINIFKANAKNLVSNISSVDRRIEASFSNTKRRPFIVFHDAYQYFEKRFGLNGLGSITLDPHDFSSPKRLRQIKTKLKTTGAACIFKEPQFSNRLITTVTAGHSIKVISLDPLGSALKSGSDHYLKLLTSVHNSFKECFQPSEG